MVAPAVLNAAASSSDAQPQKNLGSVILPLPGHLRDASRERPKRVTDKLMESAQPTSPGMNRNEGAIPATAGDFKRIRQRQELSAKYSVERGDAMLTPNLYLEVATRKRVSLEQEALMACLDDGLTDSDES